MACLHTFIFACAFINWIKPQKLISYRYFLWNLFAIKVLAMATRCQRGKEDDENLLQSGKT